MVQMALFPSMVLEEAWLQEKVSPIYPELWRMIRTPFDDLLARRGHDRAFRILTEGQTAQWLRPQIVDQARQIFEGDSTIKVMERRQQLYLNYQDAFAITPKKFKPTRDGKGITFSSYETDQNRDYWKRREVAGLPMLPRLIVGYQFVQEMTDIKIWVAYPYGKSVKTYLLIPEQSGAVMGIYQPPAALVEEEEPGYKVVPKKRKKSGTAGREPA